MIDCLFKSEPAASQLSGLQGALIELRIPVEPKLLEDLIEALASLDFPVNPRLLHHPGVVFVEFPANASHLAAVRSTLSEVGLNPQLIEVSKPGDSLPFCVPAL